MSIRRTLLIEILALALSSALGAQGLGLVGVRSQSPFDQLFLALTPEAAGTLPHGQVRSDISVTWSNTFILSKGVRNWVVNYRSPGRHGLNQTEIGRLLALYPTTDLYMFDGELARFNLRVSYGLTDRLQLTLGTAVQTQGGGFADSSIESFHGSFRFANAEREYFPQNHYQLFMRLGGRQVFFDGASANPVLGDTTCELKLRARQTWHGWLSSVSVAVKAPTGSRADLAGSGRWDAQLAGYASRRVGPGRLHLNLAYALLGGTDSLPGLTANNLWTFVAGYELWSPRRRVNWILQATAETSVFRGTTPSDLARPSYLVLGGARVPAGRRGTLTFALVENVVELDNSADLVLHVGYSRTFGSD
ncbi:MAG: DUF3187 family protein [Acidobacteria bacterium]|jgi:hypothetical protein|nr:DUF3187 family protein [Acidobacteriota bacterium]